MAELLSNVALAVTMLVSGSRLLHYAHVRPELIKTGYDHALRPRAALALFIGSFIVLLYRVLS
jgi:hypothetical protein